MMMMIILIHLQLFVFRLNGFIGADDDHDNGGDDDDEDLQFFIFCLNGFIGVDPSNDCLQSLLLLSLPHVGVHIADECLHVPGNNTIIVMWQCQYINLKIHFHMIAITTCPSQPSPVSQLGPQSSSERPSKEKYNQNFTIIIISKHIMMKTIIPSTRGYIW